MLELVSKQCACSQQHVPRSMWSAKCDTFILLACQALQALHSNQLYTCEHNMLYCDMYIQCRAYKRHFAYDDVFPLHPLLNT